VTPERKKPPPQLPELRRDALAQYDGLLLRGEEKTPYADARELREGADYCAALVKSIAGFLSFLLPSAAELRGDGGFGRA